MAFREVPVVEVKEVLRLWLSGHGTRAAARLSRVDRKTVRRYVAAAEAAGCVRDGGLGQLTDGLIGQVVGGARPVRASGHGQGWELCQREHAFLEAKVKAGLQLTKISDLLTRRTGILVPYPTLRRFAVAEFDFGGPRVTVRVADAAPGQEAQMDFGRLGLLDDPVTARRRVCHGLIVTAVFSRHVFVWPTFRQTLAALIEGLDAAWEFFGGVFAVLIPDNVKAIVDAADPTNPRLNQAFVDYAQARGFVVDAARVRRPCDKPRVERSVQYVRGSFFAGETFTDLSQTRERAVVWANTTAGMRIHGTTARRPVEVFRTEEQPLLLPAPTARFDVPLYRRAKVHRDCHIEVARSLYSVPHALVGEHVEVRADSALVKVFWRGEVIKTHPRLEPGRRSTDPADYPAERSVYAMRDIESLRRLAHSHGTHVGAYADALLAGPLPWTKMRQVYRLLGLVRRYGSACVDQACSRTLEIDVVDVPRVARIVEKATEKTRPGVNDRPSNVVPLRFARAADDFTTPKGAPDAR